jgi:hypothetical protein
MRLLVATEETQGRRPSDFCFCEEGEIVTFAYECTREAVDGPCGCKRSLSGVQSFMATTTVRVTDQEQMNVPALADLLASTLVAQGWFKSKARAMPQALKDADMLAEVANGFPVGTVLERRGDVFGTRRRLVM